MRRILCEHQTYYEKTYSLNPGDSGLRRCPVVLHNRTRRHDDDNDTYGVSRHKHADPHQHNRDAPEHGWLRPLSWEFNLLGEGEALLVSFSFFARTDELPLETLALGRRFGFLFNCLTNDRRDRL